MRATLADVVRHPSWLGSWWLEWPGRRRYWWREVLREPGQGWLRWAGLAVSVRGMGPYEPPDEQYVMPPARRLATWLRYRVELLHPSIRRLYGRPFSLATWSADLVSDDRRRLWKQG